MVKIKTGSWVGERPLINVVAYMGFMLNSIARVRDYIMPNGDWDKERLTASLPIEVVNQILCIIPPTLLASPDTSYWALSPSSTWTTLPLISGDTRRQEEILVGWTPPPKEWIAVNSDGAYKSAVRIASAV
ncbi:Uncharacterized protein TCM_038171 [Theobroma cacao]|uniref:Uncharacterized protein n=1 Tax=Theobroma cacao TaxID=3641 RepID=A0A061GP94_THECC|nr:Uncharacterized protein TCM_038171 [Theobroma cacao]